MVKLERHSERGIDVGGQERCPVIGVRCDVAQRITIREKLNNTAVGDLGDGGRLGITIVVAGG